MVASLLNLEKKFIFYFYLDNFSELFVKHCFLRYFQNWLILMVDVLNFISHRRNPKLYRSDKTIFETFKTKEVAYFWDTLYIFVVITGRGCSWIGIFVKFALKTIITRAANFFTISGSKEIFQTMLKDEKLVPWYWK